MMGCDYDVLDGTRGSLFGIDKSELVFGERSDTGRALTNSEVIVRTWNASLLCRTIVQDGVGMCSHCQPRCHEESFQ